MSNAERFLNAYTKIENHLKSTYDFDSGDSFSYMLKNAARKNPAIRSYQDELRQYHELRNAIVHNRPDGKPIADPYNETVKNFERITELILDPPIVYPEFQSDVTTLPISTSVTEAVSLMHEHSYSQVPILDENSNFVDLLTANTVTRWLGANIDNGMAILEEKTVSDALDYKENMESFCFISRETNLAKVLSIFDDNRDRKEVINAILITQNGKETEKLLGIITHYDLPEIYSRL